MRVISSKLGVFNTEIIGPCILAQLGGADSFLLDSTSVNPLDRLAP